MAAAKPGPGIFIAKLPEKSFVRGNGFRPHQRRLGRPACAGAGVLWLAKWGEAGGVPGPMQACHRPFAGLHEVAGKQQADVEGSEMGGQPHRTLFGL